MKWETDLQNPTAHFVCFKWKANSARSHAPDLILLDPYNMLLLRYDSLNFLRLIGLKDKMLNQRVFYGNYLWTDGGKEIDSRGTRHISFRIGNPARIVIPFQDYFNP